MREEAGDAGGGHTMKLWAVTNVIEETDIRMGAVG